MSASVTHIVPTINREASGPSYCVPRLCRALADAGTKTKLAVLEPLPENVDFTFAVPFPYGRIGPRRLGMSPQMKHWLRQQANTGCSDILHNNSLWMVTNVYPAMAVRDTSAKLIVSPHGTLTEYALSRSALIKKLLWPILVKPVLKSATGFHATAHAEYEDIRRLGFRQPVAVIPNGIDVPELMVKTSKQHRTVLFLGRIHPTKGISNLLYAWSKLHHRYTHWKLVISGPDEIGHLEELKTLANELNLERCEFTGPVFGTTKLQAYRDADLYVLPTHSENFGMTVAETLAAGTPAIVTKGAPWKGLEREKAGWWIDIGVEPLTSALDSALQLPADKLMEMGQCGRDWMAREFSWSRIGVDMSKFYNWMVEGGDVPSFVRID